MSVERLEPLTMLSAGVTGASRGMDRPESFVRVESRRPSPSRERPVPASSRLELQKLEVVALDPATGLPFSPQAPLPQFRPGETIRFEAMGPDDQGNVVAMPAGALVTFHVRNTNRKNPVASLYQQGQSATLTILPARGHSLGGVANVWATAKIPTFDGSYFGTYTGTIAPNGTPSPIPPVKLFNLLVLSANRGSISVSQNVNGGGSGQSFGDGSVQFNCTIATETLFANGSFEVLGGFKPAPGGTSTSLIGATFQGHFQSSPNGVVTAGGTWTADSGSGDWNVYRTGPPGRPPQFPGPKPKPSRVQSGDTLTLTSPKLLVTRAD